MSHGSKNIKKQEKAIHKILRREYELTIDSNPFTNDGYYLINKITKIHTSRHEAITYLMDRFGDYDLVKKQYIKFYRMNIKCIKFEYIFKMFGLLWMLKLRK